mgnify:FL=1
MTNNSMKKYLPLLITIIPALFLYRMIIFGEIVTANDDLARHPINEWRDKYIAENENMPQWYPNLFSGMPSYGGYIYMTGDPTKLFRNTILYNLGLKVWFFLSLGGFGTFFLLKTLGSSSNAGVLGGLITGLTPYGFGLVNAGHLNKIFAMAYVPWVLACFLVFMKKKSLRSICVLSLITALQLWANHPQIVYYTWMIIGFYYVWSIGTEYKGKSFSLASKLYELGGVLIALFLAFLMVSDPYNEVYTFQKHSNRGAKSVLEKMEETSLGTNWNYATQWSFHPKEVISFVYPYFYGLQNFSTRDLKSAAYWGYMPFTQSTHYLGLIALILASIGALLKKPDKISLFFWITTILILITGFGKFFPLLYKPFFELFPFFSKFRIPSMIYALLPITISILAAKGYDILVSSKGEKHIFKKAFYFVGGIVAVSFLFLIVSDFMIDFSSSKDGRYNSSIQGQLRSIRYDLFNKGCFLAISVSLCFLGLYYSYAKNKISKSLFNFGVIGLIILDLGILNNEFMNVKPKKNMDRMFKKNSIIDHLISDKSNFRVFPADEITSNKYSYWNIESIGGYRPIKLRAYQDLMDAGGFNRSHILDMLNVKYVLTQKKINNPNFIPVGDLKGIYENKKVLPKAWIIGNLKIVESQKESLMETLMTGFNPYSSAVVLKYEGDDMPANVNGQAIIKLKEENKIEINCQSETGGLLVLSEVYYKPGWKAFVNGVETKIYQTNHILRSVYIPSGESEVLFEYDDSRWQNTRMLSRISILTVLMLVGFSILRERKQKSN